MDKNYPARVKSLLVHVLQLNVHPSEIGDEDLLFDGALGVDSVAAVQLISEIEREFDICILDQDITEHIFQSVKALCEMIVVCANRNVPGA